MRWSVLGVGVLSALLIASVVGMAALSGGLRGISSGPLLAEVKLHEFAVPKGFRVDRNDLTEGLLRQIEARAGADVGLRMSLDEVGQRQLKDLIIPRLINPSVVARVIENVPALQLILGVEDYRGVAEVRVVNNTDAEIDDVVFMAPAMIGVEDEAGNALPVVSREKAPTSVRLGSLMAHEARNLTVWLSEAPSEVLEKQERIRVGAADGVDGSIHLFGTSAWLGQDLEILPWSRWVVGFVVVFAGFAAGATLLLFALSAIRGRARAAHV